MTALQKESEANQKVDNVARPRYGNYCGAGYTNPSGSTAKLDSLDAACKKHDECYQRCGNDVQCKKVNCDPKLSQDLRALNPDPRRWKSPPQPEDVNSARWYKPAAQGLLNLKEEVPTAIDPF